MTGGMSGNFTTYDCERFCACIEECTLSFNASFLHHVTLCMELCAVLHCTIYVTTLIQPLYINICYRSCRSNKTKGLISPSETTKTDFNSACSGFHRIQLWKTDLELLGPLAMMYAGSSPRQRYGETTSAVPPCVFRIPSMSSCLNYTDNCSFMFSVISTSEFNHKLGSHVKDKKTKKKTSMPCWCNPSL